MPHGFGRLICQNEAIVEGYFKGHIPTGPIGDNFPDGWFRMIEEPGYFIGWIKDKLPIGNCMFAQNEGNYLQEGWFKDKGPVNAYQY